MRDTFGPTSPRQFAEYDPDTSCWKTYPATGLWGSVEYSGTWPRCGMTCGGRAYELPTWAPLTGGNGSSSLLLLSTPDTSPEAPNTGSNRKSHPSGLGNQVQSLLPTPRTSDTNGAGEHGTGGPDLRTVAATLLPTPTSRDHKGANQRGDDSCLWGALLPTPRATDGTNGGPNQRGSSGDLMLPSAVQALLPTPTAADSKASGGSTPSDVTLTDAIIRTALGTQDNPRLLLPTPAANDSGNTPENHLRKKPGRSTVTSLQVVIDYGLLPTGGRIAERSSDGNGYSVEPLPLPPSSDPEQDSDSAPVSSSS